MKLLLVNLEENFRLRCRMKYFSYLTRPLSVLGKGTGHEK